MFCGYCGGEIQPGATRCPHCGRLLAEPKQPSRRHFPWLGFVLIVLAVVAVVMVILAWNLLGDREEHAVTTVATPPAQSRDFTESQAMSPVFSETAPKETDGPEPAPPDSTHSKAVGLEDVIGIYAKEQFSYENLMGDVVDISCTVPMFILDTPDARACNEELLGACARYLEDIEYAMETETHTDVTEIYYEAWILDDTVTLLVTVGSNTDCTRYYAYTLDLTNGELVDRDRLAVRLGVTPEELKAAGQEALEEAFVGMYGDFGTDDFYDSQLERTISEENLEESVFYRTRNGEVMLLADVYSLAGADRYAHLIPVALSR